MRILIALVLIAAVGWSGYWFYGARSLHRAIRAEIAELRSDGISVETDDISVTGFPNQFDTTFTTPRLAWPSGVVWSAPFLQIFALSYRPNQIIVALPPRQSLSGPFGEAVIENGRARASGLFRTDGQLTLDHANLVADDVRVTIENRVVEVVKLLAAARVPDGAKPTRQNIGLTVDDLDLPQPLAARLGGAATARIDGATLDATLDLSNPVSRVAIKSGDVDIERIEISRFDLDWSGMTLGADGAFDIAADGSLTGSLDITLTNWERALEIADAAGLLAPGQRGMIEQGVRALAGMTGREDRLKAPLAIRAGRIWLGPLPIGPAPEL